MTDMRQLTSADAQFLAPAGNVRAVAEADRHDEIVRSSTDRLESCPQGRG